MPKPYSGMSLSDLDIETGAYKTRFGGGAAAWDRRGAFQLRLLQALGLEPAHTLMDVGCGPLRGGVHLIEYLAHGGYAGVDANADFIRAARVIVAASASLSSKQPVLACVPCFEVAPVVAAPVDCVLAFSVLNHCTDDERRAFLMRVPDVMKDGARAIVTHAPWYDAPMLEATRLRIARRFETPADLPSELHPERWGWTASHAVFPILELRR